MIGIIANPASGKDIRRLVGQALIVGNREKVNIVKRTLIGLNSTGIKDVYLMPDIFGIGSQSIRDLEHSYPEIVDGVRILDMPIFNAPEDSTKAAAMLAEMGAEAIITLGGDGTVRDVAQTCGDVPILPISTGTNNVLPRFIEGTVAGLAVGLYVNLTSDQQKKILERQKRIDIFINGQFHDFALVDLLLTADMDVGSRAVWDVDKLLQIAVTRASIEDIGFSSILANVQTTLPNDCFGATAMIKPAGSSCEYQVTAPIGPGMIENFCIDAYRVIHPGERVQILEQRPAVLALDGERKLILKKTDQAEFEISSNGPYFMNVGKALATGQILQ